MWKGKGLAFQDGLIEQARGLIKAAVSKKFSGITVFERCRERSSSTDVHSCLLGR